MRLIDADALDMYECLKSYYGDAWRDAQEAIDNAPTIEIVRCKECKNAETLNCPAYSAGWFYAGNDYCSNGEE